jgi:LDH2 family malate/lactate/ureidoglycolate dehydrogenase
VSAVRNVPADKVREQIVRIFSAWGMDPAAVQTAAEVMVETDLSGVDSHGVSMLMDYESSRAKGKLNVKAKPRVVREGPATALIDADAGLGHPAAKLGMETAIAKAAKLGAAVVTVRNSHHFGAAGYYAALAPKRGLIGMVTSATRSINTVPTRGSEALLGTNPIAFAAPAARNRPFLLDMATSSVAANKVRVYELQGKPLPEGWVLDAAGKAVTDATVGTDILFKRTPYQGGGLAPVGGDTAGHKGYGLAMMAHILGGTLSGASFSPIRNRTQRAQDPDNIGHFFMAIDPDAFRAEGEFEADLDAAIDVLREAKPADPREPVLVAGDPEAAKRAQRLRDGIPIPDSLAEQVRAICKTHNVPFLLL